jgi:hypothetical protein
MAILVNDMKPQKSKSVYLDMCALRRPFDDQSVLRGFGTADAAHTAYAEAYNADFVTCDDEPLSLCAEVKVSVWYGTPDEFCRKEGLQ